MSALAVVSANNIWAVGEVGSDTGFDVHPLIEHWDGTQWRNIQTANGGLGLTGVAAISANDIWAVGITSSGRYNNGPFIEHWDGKQWSIIQTTIAPDAYENPLFAVVALSANDVWAVGAATRSYPLVGPTFIEHWDGKQWRIVKSPNLGQTENHYLYGAALIPGTNQIWTVGFYNNTQTVIEIYNP